MIFPEGAESHLALSVWARGGQAPLRAQAFLRERPHEPADGSGRPHIRSQPAVTWCLGLRSLGPAHRGLWAPDPVTRPPGPPSEPQHALAVHVPRVGPGSPGIRARLPSSLNVATIGRRFTWVPSANFGHASRAPVRPLASAAERSRRQSTLLDSIMLGQLPFWSLHLHLHLRVQGRYGCLNGASRPGPSVGTCGDHEFIRIRLTAVQQRRPALRADADYRVVFSVTATTVKA
jgi:hypothetical protein